jgi:acetyl/propionyl-CoA carboxylase alpha subunit
MELRRVLVCERGPMAGYIVRALKRMGIESVVLFPPDDESAPYVSEAAFSVPIPQGSVAYEDQILEVAMDAGCDGVHPGAGPLAENADFAARVEELNLVAIGPRPTLIRATANRWSTREVAVGAGVPVVKGSPPLSDGKEAAHWFAELGGQVWLKDTRGWRAATPKSAEAAARLVAVRLGTGVEKVWLEQHIPNARHLVVSVVGDQAGQILTLGERERIVRRGDAMTLDLAPAPVDDSIRIAAGRATVALASALRFVGVASVGFLANGTGGLWCLGLRPRLQVGDLLSDILHGLNSVEMQVRLALGEPLGWSATDLEATGTALGIRIRARERGRLTRWHIPAGIMLESSCFEGQEVDGLLGVMIVTGKTRQAAVIKAMAALKSLEIKGVVTDIPSHLDALGDPEFWRGRPVRSD